MANTSCALLVDGSSQKMEALKIGQPKTKEVLDEEIEEEQCEGSEKSDEDDFYTLEELDQMENKSYAYMVRRYPNIRIKRNRSFRQRPRNENQGVFNKGKSTYTRSGSGSGYKTGSVDRAKIRCFNCQELGHFSTECKKPKQIKKDEAYLELKAKYEALLKKQNSKAFIAEGKCWDDSSDEEIQEYGNLALMAKSNEAESSSSSQVPILTTIAMSSSQYK